MVTHKWQVKIPLASGELPETPAVVAAFHRFIRDARFDDVLIDVANYTHVWRGPGIRLIGHGLDVAVDDEDGIAGVTVARKRGGPQGLQDSLCDVYARAIEAVQALVADPDLGPTPVDSRRVVVRYNDRLLGGNDGSTRALLEPAIGAVLRRAHPHDEPSLHWDTDPLRRVAVTAEFNAEFTLSDVSRCLHDGVAHVS